MDGDRLNKPTLIAAYADAIDTLMVSILTIDSDAADAMSQALDAAMRMPSSSTIKPGDTITSGGEVLVALAPESPQSANFIYAAAAEVLGRDIPRTTTMIILDRAEDLLRAGLIEPQDIPDPSDATWFLD